MNIKNIISTFVLRVIGVLVVIAIVLGWAAIIMNIVNLFTHHSLNYARREVNEYFDEDYVNAIYKAEGGSGATYLYGIRSIPYDTPREARRICLNTVKNNRVRYREYGHKKYDTYLEFLGSRYCPVGAANDPRGLNENWLRNVRFFLENPEEGEE